MRGTAAASSEQIGSSTMADQLRPVTVGEVLALPELNGGMPQTVAGADQLNRTVRWVHVADSIGVTTGLDGGELLLTTGTAWPRDERKLISYLSLLLAANIAGMIVELGSRVDSIPAAAVRLFEAAGTPLIVLPHEIAFVRVTAAVHRLIIAEQSLALHARAGIHSLFTELSLRGSPLSFIVSEIARELKTAVVLEDREHRVIEFAGGDDDLLANWRTRSVALHRDAVRGHDFTGVLTTVDGGDWLVTPVDAKGRQFGHLIAFPGPAHAAGRSTVLQQGATTVAIHRIATDDDDWMLQSHRRLLSSFLTGSFRSNRSFGSQLAASGFPVDDRTFVGLAFTLDRVDRLRRLTPNVIGVLTQLGCSAITTTTDAAAGQRSLAIAISVPRTQSISDLWVGHLAQKLSQLLLPEDTFATLVVGSSSTTLEGLLDSVVEARDGTRSRATSRVGRLQVTQLALRPFESLWNNLRSDPRVQAFVASSLGPLLEYDLAHSTDLLAVLWAYVNNPGNRLRAAQAASISRSVFYQRIAQLENLLDVDLSDGSTIAGLHAAIVAHRSTLADAYRVRAP